MLEGNQPCRGSGDSEDLRGWTADGLCMGWRGQESDSERSHRSGQGITQKTSGEAHAVLGFPKGGPCPYLAEIAGPWEDRQVGMREAWEGHILPDGAGLSPPTRSAPRVAPAGWAGGGGAVLRREGSSPLPTAPSPLMERRGQL